VEFGFNSFFSWDTRSYIYGQLQFNL